MLGTIFYALGCFVAAMILSSLLIMTRPVHVRDELKPWRTFIFMFIFCLALPYGYCEVLTKAFGKQMEGAIVKAYEHTNINGPLRYFKITAYKKTTAKALVVGTDLQQSGFTDDPVISVSLSKGDDGKWKPDSYKILTSGRLNQDCFVFPPYY